MYQTQLSEGGFMEGRLLASSSDTGLCSFRGQGSRARECETFGSYAPAWNGIAFDHDPERKRRHQSTESSGKAGNHGQHPTTHASEEALPVEGYADVRRTG